MSVFRSWLALLIVSCLAGGSPAQPADMVPIPGGTFTRGTIGSNDDESPAHQVSIPPFFMDRTEVTYEQYDACVKRGSCTPAHYDDGVCLAWVAPGFVSVKVPAGLRSSRFPVVCVTWDQARAYCAFAGKRLPTEAQWEYAALSGTVNVYSWGNEPPSSRQCATADRRCPHNAASYKPNAWGLYDMTGNVWEWTADWYQKDKYAEAKAGSDADARQGPPVGRYRVVRGGGWYSGPRELRIRNRHWFSPEYGEVSLGFRCVR